MVVLRRLVDAIDDGDRILAVIKGSAVNNDGARKISYMAPSVDGQSAAIAEALAVADVDPASIGYVEAHGTGTAVGDPIEVAALNQAFGAAGGAGSGSGAMIVPSRPRPISRPAMVKVAGQPATSASSRAPAPPTRAAVRKPNW